MKPLAATALILAVLTPGFLPLASFAETTVQLPAGLGQVTIGGVSIAQGGRYVVGFTTPAALPGVNQNVGGALWIRNNPEMRWGVAQVNTPVAFHAWAKLNAPVLRWVVPSLPLAFGFTPSDPRWADQYAPQLIHAPAAWDTTFGRARVVVSVIDSGISNHEDIDSGKIQFGSDYVDGGNPDDNTGHGTAVAGIIAAMIGNPEGGIAGLAPDVTVRIFKAADTDDLADALHAAAGSDVITMSMGTAGAGGRTVDLENVREAVQYAWSRGSLLVASAGNVGAYGVGCPVAYPARYPAVVAVTSINRWRESSDHSCTGPESFVSAPGLNVLSTQIGGGYAEFTGTSIATPHVAAIAALMKSHHGGRFISNTQLRDMLRLSAVDLGPEGHDSKFGFGHVSGYGAACDFTRGVVVFEHNPFDGGCTEFAGDVGNVAGNEYSTGLLVGRSLSSMIVKPGQNVRAWTGFDFTGDSRLYSGTVQFVGTPMNDRIVSLDLIAQSATCSGDSMVRLWVDDFAGGCRAWDTTDSTLHDDGFGDTASSICVTAGYKATLYEHTNFGGASREYGGCVGFQAGFQSFNDVASSLKLVHVEA